MLERAESNCVTIIPTFEDNFCYVVEYSTGNALLIDPAEPSKVWPVVSQMPLKITHIMATHHHWDHSGGNNEMVKLLKERGEEKVEVVGGRKDAVEGKTISVGDVDELELGKFKVSFLETPGHTNGHICYYFDSADETMVFTGDCLFVGGCGKFFEGSADEMFGSFMKLAVLPRSTLVYVGHEYTISNYSFATKAVQTDAVAARAQWAAEKRANGEFTVPSTIGDEIDSNVFMMAVLEKEGVNGGVWGGFLTKCGCAAGSSFLPAELLGKVREAKDKNLLK
ncbi:hypothetical protein TL16_g09133 [Triparma laevis f. inornata]|uniref:Metallo-beta-lactamase domain-containing protein n=1 Tax=Triparma laevis f. inornata TaxID=1714386 RepID=A0A9W7EK67_9STRA|nr:hypothetical protein TL16_g09133 [Triparma laevis f. inornata]